MTHPSSSSICEIALFRIGIAALGGCKDTDLEGVSGLEVAAAGKRFSVEMDLRHACLKLSGVFWAPNPKTSAPSSRMREARRVKSLSEDTRQKPSNRPLCSRSIASMTNAMSDAFFPLV